MLNESSAGELSPVELAFHLTLGRGSEPAERAAALEFLEKQRAVYAQTEEAEQKAMTDFCQMLFASSAFLYVE